MHEFLVKSGTCHSTFLPFMFYFGNPFSKSKDYWDTYMGGGLSKTGVISGNDVYLSIIEIAFISLILS